VNLLGDTIVAIKKNTGTFIETNKEVGLEVNLEKTKRMLLPRRQNAGQNHDIKTANKFLENAAQFIYLGTTVTNENLIQKEIKRRLNSGNACCHSVHKFEKDRSKNIKTIICPVVPYGCETWCLTLMEEHCLSVFKNREYLARRGMK
jgi:hypothetical protein